MVYWRDADFSVLAESRSKRDRHKFANLVGAFDTETTTCTIGETVYAFMYVWQFAVEDIAVYGRTWDDLREFLTNLRADLHLSSEYKLIVYVHNLKYDFQFFKSQLNIEGDFIARDSRTIIKMTLQDCIELRDSGCYTEEPLAAMGAEIGFPKLDGNEYDYTKIRHYLTPLTEEEMAYCERDVMILTRYYRREADKYGSVKNIPITATRRVKRLIMNELYSSGKKIRLMVESKQLKPLVDGAEVNEKHKHDAAMLEVLRTAFFGGFTYSNVYYRNNAVQNVTGADISSSYPAQAILHRFPMGHFESLPVPKSIEDLKSERRYKNKALLITFKLSPEGKQNALDAKYPGVSFLSLQDKNYWTHGKTDRRNLSANKLLHAKDEITLTLTDIDFHLFLKFYRYGKIEFLNVLGAEYGLLPDYIIKVITDLYQNKLNLKMRNKEIALSRPLTAAEEAEYMLAKSMLNRIYGIFVQDPIRTLYQWDSEIGIIKPFGDQPLTKFEGVLYQWGVWMVAWSRYEILNIFAAIGIEDDKYKNNILHCDTDSIYFRDENSEVVTRYNAYISKNVREACIKRRINPHALSGIGELTIEHYHALKTLGLKQYAYIDDAGRFDYHCAGLTRQDYVGGINRGMSYFDQFKTPEDKINAFSPTMYIPPEQAKINKNIYVDFPKEKMIPVTDYLGNTTNVEISSYILIDYDDYDPSRVDSIADMLSRVNDERLRFVAKRFL